MDWYSSVRPVSLIAPKRKFLSNFSRFTHIHGWKYSSACAFLSLCLSHTHSISCVCVCVCVCVSCEWVDVCVCVCVRMCAKFNNEKKAGDVDADT